GCEEPGIRAMMAAPAESPRADAGLRIGHGPWLVPEPVHQARPMADPSPHIGRHPWLGPEPVYQARPAPRPGAGECEPWTIRPTAGAQRDPPSTAAARHGTPSRGHSPAPSSPVPTCAILPRASAAVGP